MGEDFQNHDEVILYRPVYSCVPHNKLTVTNTNNTSNSSNQIRDQIGDQREEAEAICEDITVDPERRTSTRSIDDGESVNQTDQLKAAVVTLDEVSSCESWEVIALNK